MSNEEKQSVVRTLWEVRNDLVREAQEIIHEVESIDERIQELNNEKGKD